MTKLLILKTAVGNSAFAITSCMAGFSPHPDPLPKGEGGTIHGTIFLKWPSMIISVASVPKSAFYFVTLPERTTTQPPPTPPYQGGK
jgi:hypothetical protein